MRRKLSSNLENVRCAEKVARVPPINPRSIFEQSNHCAFLLIKNCLEIKTLLMEKSSYQHHHSHATAAAKLLASVALAPPS